MNLLPFEKIQYKTDLKLEEITRLLKNEVQPRQTFSLKHVFNNDFVKPYYGYIEANCFKICRRINYKNSFNPIIEGKIEDTNLGSIVRLKIRPRTFTTVFMTFWCITISLFFFVTLIHQLASSSFSYEILMPLGMLAFGYGMTLFGFNHEAKKSRQFFSKMFSKNFISHS